MDTPHLVSRKRRFAAYVIDSLPLLYVALVLVPVDGLTGPMLLIERTLGLGIYDPTVGGDPVLTQAFSSPLLAGSLAIAAVWLVVQAVVVFLQGRSVGCAVLSLVAESVASPVHPRILAFRRLALRLAPFLAVLLLHWIATLFAATSPVTAAIVLTIVPVPVLAELGAVFVAFRRTGTGKPSLIDQYTCSRLRPS